MRSGFHCVTMTLLVILACVYARPAYGIDQTATGFFYPTGTIILGNYAGWLEEPPIYFDGYYHIGKDIAAGTGDAVYAISGGEVISISTGGWGTNNVGVFVRHQLGDGTQFVALYGHVRTNVTVGQQIASGTEFATIGPTDDVHLHFGIHPGASMPDIPYGKMPLPVESPYNGWTSPINWITSYTPMTFACAYSGQTPKDANGYYNLHPGDVTTFWVDFDNISSSGSPAWQNSGGVSNPNYIELKPCTVTGSLTSGWLYNSGDWINSTRVTSMNQSSVSRGATARFEFRVKVPDNASLGVHDNWFRLSHVTGGLIQDWGGLSFNVNVVTPIPEASYTALVGNFNGDALEDIGLYESANGRWFIAANQADMFNQINGPYTYNSWLNDWGTGSGYTPLVGDFNEDGKSDVCVYRSQYGRWYVALNNYGTANSFTQANGPYSESSWMTDWGTGSDFAPLVGDFNGDGKTDICVYRPQYGRWYVALNNYGTQNSFTQSNGPYSESSWLTDWGTGSEYTPLVGDFNGDGKSDIALYQAQYGRWFVAFNNYGTQNSFTQANGTYTVQSWYTDWGTGSGNVPLIGDFNNDGKSDIAYYQSQYGRWYVAYNDYSTYNRFDVASGTATNGSWLTDWGTGPGMTPLLGNFSTGPHDIGLFDPSLGRWFVAFNDYGTAQRFTQTDGPYAAYSWYDDWGKESGSPKIVAAGESSLLPVTLALSQNYPNPFNPVTTISYSVAEASYVSLVVYNILGQGVATLVNKYQPAGSYSIPWDATSLPSGVYVYRLHTDQVTETRKMLILK